jgi:GT2 family glycosyltransferase
MLRSDFPPKGHQPMLSIVFFNYNRLLETRHTLEQLQKVCAHRSDIEIIAVDNGSTDGTLEFNAHHFDLLMYWIGSSIVIFCINSLTIYKIK